MVPLLHFADVSKPLVKVSLGNLSSSGEGVLQTDVFRAFLLKLSISFFIHLIFLFNSSFSLRRKSFVEFLQLPLGPLCIECEAIVKFKDQLLLVENPNSGLCNKV